MARLAVALLGSGEFEPWAAQVDRWLLERGGGRGRALVLPTASAPEGDSVFDRWAKMGLRHYARLGVLAEVVPLKTRQDAERPEVVRMLDEASLVFFSGGNPAYLAATLRDTPFWRELRTAMGQGRVAYGGCSAGIACLGERAPNSAMRELHPERWQPGLGLFKRVQFGPHWDRLNVFRPGLRDCILSSLPPGHCLVGVDERTALVGDGVEWSVLGSGAVHVLDAGLWREHRAGESFSLPLAVADD